MEFFREPTFVKVKNKNKISQKRTLCMKQK